MHVWLPLRILRLPLWMLSCGWGPIATMLWCVCAGLLPA
jgi:hypothetical protein